MVAGLIDYADEKSRNVGIALRPSLTTNGTITDNRAWQVMTRADLDLAISCDGIPTVHDRHRVAADGRGSAADVLRTIDKLFVSGKSLQVVMVVRPDSLPYLVAGMNLLQSHGVSRFNLTLDLWASWQPSDVVELERALVASADFWHSGLPDVSINWFDEKLAQLTQTPQQKNRPLLLWRRTNRGRTLG